MSARPDVPPASSGPAGNSHLSAALAGAVAMSVAMGLGRFFYTPVLPAMMTDLSMGPAQAGWIASANYVGYLVGAVLAAYGWAEGMERRVALAGLAATAALLLLMSLDGGVLYFSLIRFLAGLASAFVMVFSTSIVVNYGLASGRTAVQSIHFGGVGGGIAGSALMFALVVAGGGNWQAAWIVAGLLALFGLGYVARSLPRPPARSGPGTPEPPLVWSPALVAITLAYGIFGFGYIVTATFLVAIVREAGGSQSFEAFVWLATGLVAAPSVALWQPVVRRIGLFGTFVAGCLVQAMGVAASVLLPLPAGPLVGGLLLGLTFIMVTAYGLQAGRSIAADSPRRLLAFMTAAFGIGQIIGPVVAGILADFSGDYVLSSLSAVVALLFSASLGFMARKYR